LLDCVVFILMNCLSYSLR